MLHALSGSLTLFKHPNMPHADPSARGLRHGSVAALLLRMWILIPPGAWMSVSCKRCVLSGRGLCDGLITRPESPTDCGALLCVI